MGESAKRRGRLGAQALHWARGPAHPDPDWALARSATSRPAPPPRGGGGGGAQARSRSGGRPGLWARGGCAAQSLLRLHAAPVAAEAAAQPSHCSLSPPPPAAAPRKKCCRRPAGPCFGSAWSWAPPAPSWNPQSWSTRPQVPPARSRRLQGHFLPFTSSAFPPSLPTSILAPVLPPPTVSSPRNTACLLSPSIFHFCFHAFHHPSFFHYLVLPLSVCPSFSHPSLNPSFLSIPLSSVLFLQCFLPLFPSLW